MANSLSQVAASPTGQSPKAPSNQLRRPCSTDIALNLEHHVRFLKDSLSSSGSSSTGP